MFPRPLLLSMLLCSAAGMCGEGDHQAVAADTPLADAAERGTDEELARLLARSKSPADVNAAQPDGMTALHWAVYRDREAMVRDLLKAKADAKRTNDYGVAPLSLACRNGNARIAALLLDAGADPNTELPGSETALLTAARTGNSAVVKLLLDRGARVDARERQGQTALMWAAAEGHADVVAVLIGGGADPQATLPAGFSPFTFAIREGRLEVVQVLLKAGCDVNRPMRVKTRVRKGASDLTSPLLLAVENGHFELAAALLAAGADPNDQRSGIAPLHALTWVRKPNRGDGDDGDPAPQGSGKLTSLEMVEALLDHGADVNLRLQRGGGGLGKLKYKQATPLLLAAKTADVPLLKLLLQRGADPKLVNVDGSTALMVAAGLGTTAPGEEAGTEPEAMEAVELLLECGLDVNAVDRNGETVMHGAAYKSFPRVAKLLAQRGARPAVWNRPNQHGWTPLSIAAGYRPGNFKPSPDTLAALREILRDAGETPPELDAIPKGKHRRDY